MTTVLDGLTSQFKSEVPEIDSVRYRQDARYRNWANAVAGAAKRRGVNIKLPHQRAGFNRKKL